MKESDFPEKYRTLGATISAEVIAAPRLPHPSAGRLCPRLRSGARAGGLQLTAGIRSCDSSFLNLFLLDVRAEGSPSFGPFYF